MLRMIRNLHRDESGQDVVEYALVLGAIAAAAVFGSATLRNTIVSAVEKINQIISNAVGSVG